MKATFFEVFKINFYDFFPNFFLQNIMGREEEWGGQLEMASWGWLQSPFFIVYLNQGHFFSKSFFINFYDFFFEFISSKHHYILESNPGHFQSQIQKHLIAMGS
jgi:hypothetical protein